MAQAQLTKKNVTFYRTEKSGTIQFRANFGRNKAIVFRQYEASGYFHVDLYNNNVDHSSCHYAGVSLGLDELDAILSMRDSMESLKAFFPIKKSSKDNTFFRPFLLSTEKNQSQLVPTTHVRQTTNMKSTIQKQNNAPESYLYQALPLQESGMNSTQHASKRHSAPYGSDNECNFKIPKYEDISPVQTELIPNEVMEDFYSTMN